MSLYDDLDEEVATSAGNAWTLKPDIKSSIFAFQPKNTPKALRNVPTIPKKPKSPELEIIEPKPRPTAFLPTNLAVPRRQSVPVTAEPSFAPVINLSKPKKDETTEEDIDGVEIDLPVFAASKEAVRNRRHSGNAPHPTTKSKVQEKFEEYNPIKPNRYNEVRQRRKRQRENPQKFIQETKQKAQKVLEKLNLVVDAKNKQKAKNVNIDYDSSSSDEGPRDNQGGAQIAPPEFLQKQGPTPITAAPRKPRAMPRLLIFSSLWQCFAFVDKIKS